MLFVALWCALLFVLGSVAYCCGCGFRVMVLATCLDLFGCGTWLFRCALRFGFAASSVFVFVVVVLIVLVGFGVIVCVRCKFVAIWCLLIAINLLYVRVCCLGLLDLLLGLANLVGLF